MANMTPRNIEITRRLTTGESPKRIAQEMGVPVNHVYVQNFNLRRRIKKDELKAQHTYEREKLKKEVEEARRRKQEENELRDENEQQRKEISRLKRIITRREAEFVDVNDRLKKANAAVQELRSRLLNDQMLQRMQKERNEAVSRYSDMLDERLKNAKIMKGAASDLDRLSRLCDEQRAEIEELKSRLEEPKSFWQRIKGV
jgi:chromosome segregation ATPase